ncbi:MAG: hypothetical protein ACE5E5_06740 [Phycisphaerae bacterium]
MFDPIHIISIVVCVLLIVGVLNRRRKSVHIPLMATAIAIDLAMVLYIELTRGAVHAARERMGLLMIVHIIISVGVLVLYGIHVWTGIKKARGGSSPTHGRIMYATITLRILNLITSIMVMGIDAKTTP